ncbi:MAG TPA: SRPBCC family protein [Flavobacterium sp.]|jgi:hypothetical protein
MRIDIPKVKVDKSATELYNSLSDVRNFEKLMPENIAKFEVLGDDSFVFGLKGMPEIKLKVREKVPQNRIVLASASDKLSFSLTSDITAVSDNASEVTLSFEGEFNAMMGMMIKGPITKFMESLSANMQKL